MDVNKEKPCGNCDLCDTCIHKDFIYSECEGGATFEQGCCDYLSENDVRMWHEAYVTLQNLLGRCVLNAGELISWRSFGRVVVVPFEVWRDYNKMKNEVEFSAKPEVDREFVADEEE